MTTPQPSLHSPSRRPARIAIVALAVSLAYAIVRYHFFKGVPWSQFPLFTINKAVAVASLVLAAAALRTGLRARANGFDAGDTRTLRREARGLGILAAIFGLWHGVVSVVLCTPQYFPALFEPTGAFNAPFGAAIATGATVLGLLIRLCFADDETAVPVGRRSAWVITALALVAIHTALIGYPSWLDTTKWPGKLPPITLISTLLAVLAIFAGSRRRR